MLRRRRMRGRLRRRLGSDARTELVVVDHLRRRCRAAALAAERPEPTEHENGEDQTADRGNLDRGRERERHRVSIGTSNEGLKNDEGRRRAPFVVHRARSRYGQTAFAIAAPGPFLLQVFPPTVLWTQ